MRDDQAPGSAPERGQGPFPWQAPTAAPPPPPGYAPPAYGPPGYGPPGYGPPGYGPPPPGDQDPRAPKRRGWLLPAAALGVFALLVGGSIGLALTLSRDGGSDVEQVWLDQVAVGECLLESTGGEEVSRVPVVPCDVPHDEEVFALLTFPDAEFPGYEALEEEGDQMCLPAFEEYVGAPYEASELYYYTITPTEKGWRAYEDRSLLCVAYGEAQLTASVRGSGR
jgi:hypothetical protein